MVPAEAISQLIGGSFEDLTSRLDDAIYESRERFVGESDGAISRLATFPERVIIVTEDGKWFDVSYEKKGNEISLGEAKEIDVPEIDPMSEEVFRSHMMSAVDSILGEDVSSAKEKLLSLVELRERAEAVPQRDFADEAVVLASAQRPWREIYAEQSSVMRSHIGDKIGKIRESQLEARYRPMYETDEIPEEKFEDYRDSVTSDLSVLAHRLETIQHRAEERYLPFYENVAGSELEEEDATVLSHFCFFSEDLIEDLQAVRQLISEAVSKEQCVMCLGHVYDVFAEALVDYEIAGAFVERMVDEYEQAA
jgi:hypothetical protein